MAAPSPPPPAPPTAGAGSVAALLARLEHALRDPSTDAATWHHAVIIAFPCAIVAFLVGWVFDVRTGGGDPFDAVAYPVMTVVALLMQGLFLRFRRHTTLLTLALLVGNGVFFAAKLAFVVLTPGDADQLGELTETFYWIPALYLVAVNANRTAFARRFCEALLAFNLGILVMAALQPAGPDHDRLVFALGQMLLANTMLYGLTLATSTFERRRATRLQTLALTDTLTGLANRSGFESELGATVETARAGEDVFALLFLDLDGFKAVNDTLGHDAGDALLREVAARLDPLRRGTDVVARVGGDEFVMLARGATRAEAEDIAAHVQHALARPFASSRGLPVGASIGLAAYPADGVDGAALLATADARMYDVKRARKACVGGPAPTRRVDVRGALARGTLRLAATPSGAVQITGPDGTCAGPDEICRSALLDGEGLPLVHWWSAQVAAQLARGGDAHFSVPRALLDPRLADLVLAALARAGVPAHALHVTVPAAVLHPDEHGTWPVLGALTAAGVHVHLDDATPATLAHARTLTAILATHDTSPHPGPHAARHSRLAPRGTDDAAPPP